MLDGQFRKQIDNLTQPVGRSAKKAGISADMVTASGMVIAAGCAVAVGFGYLQLGLLLMILSGIPDLIDGAIAKASGTSAARGAFFDSVSDRVTDAFLYGGVAWYYTRSHPGALVMLPFAVFAAASLVSYIRAKADALGFDAHVGFLERGERFVLLAGGLLFGGNVLIGVLIVTLALSIVCAVQRFVDPNRWPGPVAAGRWPRPRQPSGGASVASRHAPALGNVAVRLAEPGVGLRDRLLGELTVNAYRSGELLSRVVPRPIGAAVTTSIGRAVSVSAGDKRTIVERNLRRGYGSDLDDASLATSVRATFDSYARYYYDSFRLPSMSPARIERGIHIEGVEHVEAAMAEDPVGPVLALPHLGGWEWAAAWITQVRGWRLAAVVEELEPPELFDWFLRFRESLGMNIIPLGPDAAAQVAAAAIDHEVVCLLSDRDIGGAGIEVEFFGETTKLPAGPAIMALRTGCRILPTAVYFNKGDGVTGVVRPPLDTSRQGRLREDVTRVTQALAHELEHLIRRAPEQWHLMQPNWPSDYNALGISPPT
jgi:KDO2-lipid IV(A) lauroyltransferase